MLSCTLCEACALTRNGHETTRVTSVTHPNDARMMYFWCTFATLPYRCGHPQPPMCFCGPISLYEMANRSSLAQMFPISGPRSSSDSQNCHSLTRCFRSVEQVDRRTVHVTGLWYISQFLLARCLSSFLFSQRTNFVCAADGCTPDIGPCIRKHKTHSNF